MKISEHTYSVLRSVISGALGRGTQNVILSRHSPNKHVRPARKIYRRIKLEFLTISYRIPRPRISRQDNKARPLLTALRVSNICAETSVNKISGTCGTIRVLLWVILGILRGSISEERSPPLPPTLALNETSVHPDELSQIAYVGLKYIPRGDPIAYYCT